MRLDSGGKVGLGTTGSDYALSIREADNNNKWLMFQKNSGQQILQIREDGDNHAIIDGSHASGELHFYTAGSERLRITSTGYIGINTSSPQYPLHVAGHTTNSAPDGIGVLMGLQHNHALIHLNAESDLGCIIDFSTPNNDRKGGILYYHSNNSTVANRDAMMFHTASAERLRITSGGSVLIGDDTQNWKFQVFGGRSSFTDTTTYAIAVRKNSAQSANFNYWIGAAAANDSTNPDIVFSNNIGTERLRLTDDGRLSINDSTPNSNEILTIQPVGNNVCDVALKMNTSTDSRIKFYDSGGTWRGGFAFTEYSNSSDYPNFHDSFYMQTDPGSNGSLEVAMRVNHNGCFIFPKQPCFSVVMTNDYNTSGDHTADFNTKRFDQANNFNTGSNGIFTAPVTGKYYMNATIQTYGGSGTGNHIMGVSFLVNGSVQSSKASGDQYWGRDNAGQYMSVNNHRILNLAQGDTVQVRIQLHGNVSIEGSGGTDRCNWQGYLVA